MKKTEKSSSVDNKIFISDDDLRLFLETKHTFGYEDEQTKTIDGHIYYNYDELVKFYGFKIHFANNNKGRFDGWTYVIGTHPWIDYNLEKGNLHKSTNKLATGGSVMSDGKFKLRGFPPIDKVELMGLYDDFKENFSSKIERFTKHFNKVHNSKLRLIDIKELMDYAKMNFVSKGGIVEYHDYKGVEIMYEPTYEEYFVNDLVFNSLEKAHKYIDSGEANETPTYIQNLYRRGAMAKGGGVSSWNTLTIEKIGKNFPYKLNALNEILQNAGGKRNGKIYDFSLDRQSNKYDTFAQFVYSASIILNDTGSDSVTPSGTYFSQKSLPIRFYLRLTIRKDGNNNPITINASKDVAGGMSIYKSMEVNSLYDIEKYINSIIRDNPPNNLENMVYKDGGSVKNGYMVFNYTDNLYATNEIFQTKNDAKRFIDEFKKRFVLQGYYRDSNMNKIDINDVDLYVLDADFNPYKFSEGGIVTYANLDLNTNRNIIAKAIEFISGTGVDAESMTLEGKEIRFKYRTSNTYTTISQKLISDTISTNRKILELRGKNFKKGGSVDDFSEYNFQVGDKLDLGSKGIKYFKQYDGEKIIVVDSKSDLKSSKGSYTYPSSVKKVLNKRYSNGGEIQVGNKFGDWSITQYKPIVYEDIGGTRDGLIKLVNQDTFEVILVQYDRALRNPKWFAISKGVQFEGKSPKEVIEKLNLATGGMFKDGGGIADDNKNKLWYEVLQKFFKIFYGEYEDDTAEKHIKDSQVTTDQAKYYYENFMDKYKTERTLSDGFKIFKQSLTKEELDSIQISFNSEDYADAEEHDTQKRYSTITIKKKENFKKGGSVDETMHFFVVRDKNDKNYNRVGYSIDETITDYKQGNEFEKLYFENNKLPKKYNVKDLIYLQQRDTFTQKDRFGFESDFVLLVEYESLPFPYYYLYDVNKKIVGGDGGLSWIKTYLPKDFKFNDSYGEGGSVIDEQVYIDYMNKEKGFKRDRIYFDSYAEAVEWGRKNFERFNTDMINYV